MKSTARAKGTALAPVVEFLREHADQARQRLDPQYHRYLEPTVIIASHQWYPETDFLALVKCQGELSKPPPGENVYEWLGTQRARKYFTSTYRDLHPIRSGKSSGANAPDAGELLIALGRVWSYLHDTGRLEVVILGPDSVQVDLIDYACPNPMMCGIIAGTLRAHPHFRRLVKSQCACRGAPSCRWKVYWKELPVS